MEKIIAAGGIVSNNKGDILFMFRRGKWDLPKGKLDEGETIEQCAVREVEEETGLRNVILGKPLGTTIHHYKEMGKLIEKETHWYAMEVTEDQKLTPQKEEDILELRWVSNNAIHEYLSKSYHNIKEIIARYKA